MAYGRWRSQKVRKARVEIIPLIDVMFLLLCFFVYATMNMVVRQGINVDLAQSSTSSEIQEKQVHMLSIDKKGRFFLDKQHMRESRLEAELKKISSDPSKPTLVINADANALHRQVVALLDIVRQSGVQNAVFAVEPTEE